MKLAELPAITIYLILIAGEKDRCITMSVVRLFAMGEISAALQEKLDVSKCELHGDALIWSDWIYSESVRRYVIQSFGILSKTNTMFFHRTMTLLWLLQCIINVDIGIPKSETCWGFDEIPLPCSKDLWEAATESEWNMRYREHKSIKKESHILRVGDLRAAQQVNTAALSSKLRAEDLQKLELDY
jgi:hypothetical protein